MLSFGKNCHFKMIRESIFSPDFKINDKVSLRGKFSNFLRPTIFRDTQMSESCIIEWVNLLLEMATSIIFASFESLVNCKQYFQPTGNLNLIEFER